jgi:cytochrome c553
VKAAAMLLRVVAALSLSGAGPALIPASAADPEALRQRAQTCAACHGANGNSPTPEVPSLAGQPKQFITTQLVMFREGRRLNPPMAALTANLSNAEINELGGYFAALPLLPAAAEQSEEQRQAGRARAERFNCVQCHGAALKGQQHIPRLAGQQAAYLRNQLYGFKAQTRFDMDGNMTSAAQALAPDDIDALAAYLAALP